MTKVTSTSEAFTYSTTIAILRPTNTSGLWPDQTSLSHYRPTSRPRHARDRPSHAQQFPSATSYLVRTKL